MRDINSRDGSSLCVSRFVSCFKSWGCKGNRKTEETCKFLSLSILFRIFSFHLLPHLLSISKLESTLILISCPLRVFPDTQKGSWATSISHSLLHVLFMCENGMKEKGGENSRLDDEQTAGGREGSQTCKEEGTRGWFKQDTLLKKSIELQWNYMESHDHDPRKDTRRRQVIRKSLLSESSHLIFWITWNDRRDLFLWQGINVIPCKVLRGTDLKSFLDCSFFVSHTRVASILFVSC